MSDDKDKPAILVLATKTDELVAAVAGLIRNEKSMVDYHRYNARMLHTKYEALIDEGFTADQALELCKDLT